ncbi:aminotransferase class IV [Legionella quinlivanii]|uniref:aminotransferase class IV n=1 Tax=Legionella quinlivanii TaxID=45073 RepID=UPI00224436DD|nr:aminotransferase class IV [Legionella quinlivanii]MCW8451285.1 aminotransferase class IV [Legionella quinlivanii]
MIRIHFQPPGASLCLSSADRLFLGEAVFETLKVRNGKALYTGLHWRRLRNAAASLNIPFTLALEEWQRVIGQYLKEQNFTDGGLKIILTPGEAPRGLTPRGINPHLVLEFFTYQSVQTPLTIVSSPWQRDRKNPVYQYKSVSYFEAILARRWAVNQNADDVLFFNTESRATETSIANFFIIYQDRIETPVPSEGLIPGILRERILSICKDNQIECRESRVSRAMIKDAEALFTSNVLQGVKAVSRIDHLDKNSVHPLFTRLSALLAKDIDESGYL